MSHLALYRKYRPEDFDEIFGQDAAVLTLKNEVLSGRISHAYLFSGPRGTGKTSVAKIFARAVNCSKLDSDGNTCGQCDSCVYSYNGTNTDIVEIDAASNNGVDNIRTIIEEAKYVPQYGKYKVYIIDEVHMLSQSAFNALLKTIEEPCNNVIFILATTELHKVPATIKSRCQQFQFKLLSEDLLYEIMDDIIYSENLDAGSERYEASKEALQYIAKLAKGSARDALSILDQCLSFTPHLKLIDIKDIFGEIDDTVIEDLIGYINNKEIPELFNCLDEQIQEGKSLSNICSSLYDYYKAEYFKNPIEEYERYMRILGELDGTLRQSTSNTRTIFEISMIKLCKPQMESDITSLSLRIQELEKEMESLKENGISSSLTKTEKLPEGIIEMFFPKQPIITMEVLN